MAAQVSHAVAAEILTPPLFQHPDSILTVDIPEAGSLVGTGVGVEAFTSDVGPDGLPAWFKPQLFLEPAFDADAYVADLRRFVPLETLSGELERHLTTLKNRLVEVINEDYADFVSLSTKLVNVDGAVLRMQAPLLELQEQLRAEGAAVQSELVALEEGLGRRAAVAASRSILELMQNIAHVMSKVEKLLEEVDASAAAATVESPEALDARVRLYERVASEVSRLNFHAAKGAQLPFVLQLGPRIRAATAKLQAALGGGLQSALRSGNAAATQHVLHAYAAIGDHGGAETGVRTELVAPAVARVLEAQKSNGPGGGTDVLAKVLASISEAVEIECGALLRAVLTPQSGLHGFNLLANSVLAEVDDALLRAMPGVFSPGVPAAFLANYRAASAFLDGLERLCTLRSDVETFRASLVVDSFLKRWKLPVYFSLRFQEIAGGLNTPVTATDLALVLAADRSADPLGLGMKASVALVQSLQECISPDVTLRPLADKFARLALQLLARYATWLTQGLAIVPPPPPLLPSATESSVGSVPKTSPPQGPEGWARRGLPEQLALVRSDVDAVVSWVGQTYAQQLGDALDFLPPPVQDAVQQALAEGITAVAAAAEGVSDIAVGAISERCCTVLKQLRAISTTYRMVNRPLPTRPSHYVAGVLTPLRAYLDDPSARGLSPAARAELSEGAIAAVSARYQAMAADMLDTVRKTESSLRRLKKGRAGEAAAMEGAMLVSDTDKISMQLFLDVQEYGRQIFKYDISPADLVVYQTLWQTVAPPEQQEVDAALLLG